MSVSVWIKLLILLLQEGVTALGMASQEGHVAVVKLLLEAKAKTDIQAKVTLAAITYLPQSELK